MMEKFYQFKKVEGEMTELYIFGEITSYKWNEKDVEAFDIAKELNDVEGDLLVRINSYGGEVSQGLAIYNLLVDFGKQHKVITQNDGFACSAASVIFMAGEERIMKDASLLMIHNAWSWASGDSNALKKAAEDLEKVTQPSVKIYTSVGKLDEAEVKRMMDREEWITAEEALSYGFATRIDKAEVKQTLKSDIIYNVVLKNKELQKQLDVQLKKQDAWASFFNGGK